MPAPLGVGDQLGAIDVGQEGGQSGLVLGQDRGEVDGDRVGAVGERDDLGVALNGFEAPHDINPKEAGSAAPSCRQVGLQPLRQLPNRKIPAQ